MVQVQLTVLVVVAFWLAALPLASNAPSNIQFTHTSKQGLESDSAAEFSFDDKAEKISENSFQYQEDPDFTKAVRNIVRKRRYVLQGSKWHKFDLKYKILSYPEGLRRIRVRHEIQRAFDEWSKYTNLKFTLVSNSEEADIKIKFAKKSHGDNDNFEGPQGQQEVLAYTFYPQYGGEIRFDKDKFWTIGSQDGFNLFQIAVHEIGHALGLKHSSDRLSVMWPTYSSYIEHMHLSADDIKAIQALYGTKDDEDVENEKILCDGNKIDTVLSTHDGIYIFKGIYYWFLGDTISKPEAKLITDTWTALPGDIDAAFTDKSGKNYYFFKGNQYWKYKGNQLDGKSYPRNVSKGFPGIPDDIDAVFGKFEGKPELYFFKGKYYYKYDRLQNPRVASIYPRLISKRWDGLPSKIDAVIRKNDGHIYFFSGNNNYIFIDDGNDIDATGPTSLESTLQWFGCKEEPLEI